MTLYLHMDGVDDRILIPSMTFTRIVMEFSFESTTTVKQQRFWSLPFGASYVMRMPNGTDQFHAATHTSLSVNGISVANNITFIPQNEKITIDSLLNTPFTQTIHIFNSNGNDLFVKGRIFDIKVYNGNTLQAHYDLSNGTVQDRSNNGRHATLFGGTWLDDGQGGNVDPTPIPLSVQFQTKQTIFKQTSININTKQSVFKKFNTTNLTKQSIYKQVTAEFKTQQIITVSLSSYNANFATKQIIYKQSHLRHPTKQNIFKRTSSEFKTAQQILKKVINNATIKQVIYKHITENNPIQIRVIIPGAPELIGEIHLQGKRELIIYLQGERELVVNLQGKREITVYLEGGLSLIPNQNFNMVSGDTKTIIININENLSGAIVKWVLSKRGASVETLTKSGNIIDGEINITLNKADTEELQGVYVHECEVTDQQGNVSTVTSGTVTIINDMI